MLIRLCLFFAFLQVTSETFANETYWISQPGPTTKNLRKCFFINSNTGWICGDSGIIMNTTNSGNQWVIQSSHTSLELRSIFFLNKDSGWALAWVLEPDSAYFAGTMILKTTNGGIIWNRSMLADTNFYYNDIYFLDSQKGFMGGIPFFILYTLNGGITWQNAVSDSVDKNGYPVKDIKFIDSQTGYACGGSQDLAGLMWMTTNSGLNWKPKLLGPDSINEMYIASRDTIFAASGDFKFGATYFRTDDRGQSWQNYSLGYFGIITAIDFRTKKEGWMTIGYQQKLFLSTDYGNAWTIMETPDKSQLFDIVFADSLHGWTVGENGVIYKYNTLVNINEQLRYQSDFKLYQNFPNPFNPITTISYQISMSDHVTLKVFDVLGSEISSLVNHSQKPGNYNVRFDAGNLPSGIYFYELKAGDYSQIRKMLLLK